MIADQARVARQKLARFAVDPGAEGTDRGPVVDLAEQGDHGGEFGVAAEVERKPDRTRSRS